MSCSQLVEIEDLVLGTMGADQAQSLRAHVAGCMACRIEEARTLRERALFAARGNAEPAASIAVSLRARLEAEVLLPPPPAALLLAPRPGRVLATLGWLARRGHASAAAAALLFLTAALSRLGGAPTSETERGTTLVAVHEPTGEPLACAMGASFSADVRVTPANASSWSVAATREVLACLDDTHAGTCEAPVTCSSLRQ
jgi:anti-sigma factor RsiW